MVAALEASVIGNDVIIRLLLEYGVIDENLEGNRGNMGRMRVAGTQTEMVIAAIVVHKKPGAGGAR